MAIDYMIDYDCLPRRSLGIEGIIERLKGRERADIIIGLFRRNGDNRSPKEMGFEMVRTAADGSEERQIIIVQHLLDAADELKPYEQHCVGCPANLHGRPFGCIGHISFPISGEAELWLLDQLPGPDEPLTWLLLRRGIEDFKYDGSAVRPLRAAGTTHFADQRAPMRALGEFAVSADQVFEMTFLLGNIQPNHGGVLLLFFHAIRRDLEAHQIMQIGQMPLAERAQFPFLPKLQQNDDQTTSELKQFLHALYTAWRLDVPLLLDV